MTKPEVPVASSAEDALHSVQGGKVVKKDEVEKPKRVKMHKYAMLLSYQGKNYFGMQIQKEQPTIEGHLIDGLCKMNWITEEQKKNPISFHFQRAARTDKAVSAVRQICGMQLPTNINTETGPSELNAHIPQDIKVVAIRRATNSFHPQKFCDARTYSYTLPTYAFAKTTELTNSSFRISKETIDEVNSLLDIFIGTHNFYNYTSKKEYEDRSCNRYIVSFKCQEPFIFKDEVRNEEVEFITILVKGQSFILHQIRKMIGMVITVVREFQMRSYIQRSFEKGRIDVPKAPGLGLLLERVHYDFYDKKHSATHLPLTNWGEEVEKEVERIKFELITKDILETELATQSMMNWLAELVHHDFACNPESDEAPKKSFLSMAAAKATEAIEEQEQTEQVEDKETKEEPTAATA